MANKVAELSIFFPFWNEEGNIENVIKKAVPVAEKIADTEGKPSALRYSR